MKKTVLLAFVPTLLILLMLVAFVRASVGPLQIVATITLDKKPKCIAVNEETNQVYVGVEDGLLIIDGETDTVVTEILPDAEVVALAVNPQTNRIYAADYGEKIVVIDGTTNHQVGEIPERIHNQYEISVNPVTNLVYIADQTVTLGNYDRVVVYSGETNTLVTSVNIPGSNEHLYMERVGVTVNPETNRVYVTWSGNNTYVGVTEVYDPATDTWETKTSMPTNRSALCANVVNGKIYLTSGIVYGPPPSFSSKCDVTEVYDPETDSWTTKASIPTPVCSYTSAVVNNKIYVIGGSKQYTTYANCNQVYDPETDTWTETEPIPTGVRFAAAGTTTGALAPERIYVIGGSTTQFPDGSNLTQIYDPEKDVWITGAPMPTPRGGLRVAVVNDVLYAIGGFNTNGDNVLAVNEQYTPIGYIPEFPSWIILPLIFVFILVVAVVKRKSFRPT